MRKALILFIFFFLCTVQSGYSSPQDFDLPDAPAIPELSIDEIIPPDLTIYLLGRGVDPMSLSATAIKKGNKNIFLFEHDTRDLLIMLLENPDATGNLLLLTNISSPDPEASIIIFDRNNDFYSVKQLSPECVRQISITLQALVSTIYNCTVIANPLSCTVDIIDLVTNFYLLTLDCPPEE